MLSNRSRRLGDTYLHKRLLLLKDITNDPGLSVSALKWNSHICFFEVSDLLEALQWQAEAWERESKPPSRGCCLSTIDGGHLPPLLVSVHLSISRSDTRAWLFFKLIDDASPFQVIP